MASFQFTTVPCIECGAGVVSAISTHCRRLGIKQLLLITDPGLLQLGLIDPVVHALRQSKLGFTVFSGVREDPPVATVLEAVEQARRCNADGVLGIGGGSSMDVAKLVAVLAGGEQGIDEIYGVEQITGARLPLVQVPTTAGTGSEMTAVAVVTTGETTKAGIVSNVLIADVALLDAELTLGMPPALTAMTGIDAMVHAIEAYTSRLKKNPYSDMLARQALRLMSANLATAVHQGDNHDARSAMLLGAMLAGQAFANAPVAAVHALAYPLGGHFHIAHGLSNSLVLAEVLRFNMKAAAPLYAELAAVVTPGVGGDSQQRAGFFIQYLEDLIAQLALPSRLRELDIRQQDLTLLADESMNQQRLLVNNPCPVSRDDALAIYQAVY